MNFLSNARTKEFVAYLDGLRNPEGASDRDRAERSETWFRRVFGEDLTTLEAEWHGSISAMRTPLERCDPKNRERNALRRD